MRDRRKILVIKSIYDKSTSVTPVYRGSII